MDRLIYIIASVLIILWIIGFYGFNMSDFIHVLLVIGLLIVIIRLVTNRKAY